MDSYLYPDDKKGTLTINVKLTFGSDSTIEMPITITGFKKA